MDEGKSIDTYSELTSFAKVIEDHFKQEDFSMEAVNKLHTELSKYNLIAFMNDICMIVSDMEDDAYTRGHDDGRYY